MLRTLGGLFLEGTSFRKQKPLLLLTYLALEGPKGRRHLQELFWPRAQDAPNSLSVALSQLKRAGVEVQGQEVLRTGVVCDALLLKSALEKGQLEEARALYQGRFLEGADDGLGEELEEWVWSTREALAEALLLAHRREAAKYQALGLAEAGQALLKTALTLPGVRGVFTEEPPTRAEPLSEKVRRAFYAVVWAGPTRAAELLGVEPSDLELLWQRGLLDAQGQPTLRPPLTLEARRVALELARKLPRFEAATFYQAALPLWGPEDEARGRQSLLDHARTRVEDNPQEALEHLEALAPDPQVLTLRVRALERLGRYREAQELLREIPDTPEASALRGILCFRTGEREEARRQAEKALSGEAYSQGEGWNLIGLLLMGEGRFSEAIEAFSRAAVRFLVAGEKARHLGALSNRAVALAELGQGEEALREVMRAADGYPLLKARLLLNLGVVKERKGLWSEAEALYREALDLAQGVGNLEAAGRALNNLGALYHRQGLRELAAEAYERALDLAQAAREHLLLAAVLANRAELLGERASLEEAIRVLEEAGHYVLAARYRARLQG